MALNKIKVNGTTTVNTGVVYDITKATGQKYDTLSAAIGTSGNNVPPEVREGGMSIRYVSNSDNKYVQFRCIADEFTTDTTQWAIADEGVYVDNPEFVYVEVDAEGKILWAIKIDGGIYYGAGCPQQVKDYIEEKIAELSLDEYEDIVAFLSDYLGSDTTLKVMIDSINERTPEIIENPKFLEVTTDSEDKILAGRTPDGAAFEKVGFSTPKASIGGAKIENIEDPEGRTEITTDAEGKIISYRDGDGVKHEEVGIVTSKIESKSLSIAGEDLTELLRNLALSNNEYKNDSQLNIARKAKQMANIVWTPKADVLTNEGLHSAGVAVKGIPYSSVKEYKKFVGLDVSLHTFMTAVNDIHSLLYTERIAEYNPRDPSTSRSAYGRTYHGVNCISYFGNVCSAFVSTALGYPIQYNSWEFQKDVFEDFYVLSNQDEKDLCVGDILAEPGHCAIVTKVKRDSDGKFISLVLSEQSAPIHETTYSYYEIHFRKLMGKGIWCRIKNTDRLNDYNPNVFILDENENLYNFGVDYVYIDDNLTRTYYQCWSSNRDSFFNPSKWGEVEHWVQKEPGRGYSKNRILQSQTEGLLCRSLIDNNYYPITDTTVWERVKNVYEWNPYPYVYNNDIVTFAGDRATFNNNDLIYINYNKGSYTQMQLFKEQILVKTYDLPAEGFQINVSEDCRNAGMYKARLINSNSYSRYTYFEVIDTSATANIQDNLVDITFGSVYGTPLEVSVVELSGYPILHFELSKEDIKKGSVRINPLVTSYVQSLKQHYISDVTELFVRVVFSGYYGTAISELLSIGTLSSLSAFSIQASRPKELGVINESTTIVLENGLNNNTYQFSLEVGGDSIELTVLSTDNNVQWITELPQVLEESKKYIFTITNGIGNFNIINI